MQTGDDIFYYLGPTAIVCGGGSSGRRGTQIVRQQDAKAVFGKKSCFQAAENEIGRACTTQEDDGCGGVIFAIHGARDSSAMAHEGLILGGRSLGAQNSGGQAKEHEHSHPGQTHFQSTLSTTSERSSFWAAPAVNRSALATTAVTISCAEQWVLLLASAISRSSPHSS